MCDYCLGISHSPSAARSDHDFFLQLNEQKQRIDPEVCVDRDGARFGSVIDKRGLKGGLWREKGRSLNWLMFVQHVLNISHRQFHNMSLCDTIFDS